jgi:hypothetical protein
MTPGKYALVAAAIMVVVGCAQRHRIEWHKREIEETKRRGNLIIQAIDAFHLDHKTYPKSLSALSPKYLSEIPQPAWGLKSWKYETTADGKADGFVLRVDESEDTGNGDALWLRYEGRRFGWQMGD